MLYLCIYICVHVSIQVYVCTYIYTYVHLQIDEHAQTMTFGGHVFKAGDYISLNGETYLYMCTYLHMCVSIYFNQNHHC
jgi:hypothetical protein